MFVCVSVCVCQNVCVHVCVCACVSFSGLRDKDWAYFRHGLEQTNNGIKSKCNDRMLIELSLQPWAGEQNYTQTIFYVFVTVSRVHVCVCVWVRVCVRTVGVSSIGCVRHVCVLWCVTDMCEHERCR